MSFTKKIKGNVYVYELQNTCNDSYEIAFLPSGWFVNTLAEEYVFEVSVKPINQIKNTDKNLLPSLIPIFKDFLSNVDFAVMYVCESLDGQERGAARARLFLKWYNNSKDNNFTHLQCGINDTAESMVYYNGIIYHKDNPLAKILAETFENTYQELNK